ncbi:UNVERIFIED_CONTAM: hypothetical protein FKN15_017414 [Acipenser sinensis]
MEGLAARKQAVEMVLGYLKVDMEKAAAQGEDYLLLPPVSAGDCLPLPLPREDYLLLPPPPPGEDYLLLPPPMPGAACPTPPGVV